MILPTFLNRGPARWLLILLLGLGSLTAAHGQPAFQVKVTPPGPLTSGTSQTLTTSAIYPSFGAGSGFNGQVNAIAIQADGKIVVGGSFTSYNGSPANTCNGIARLNLDGSLDASFITGTGFSGLGVSAIVIQPDGKMLVGGGFTSYNGSAANVCQGITRLYPDGNLDTGFVSSAVGNVAAIAVQSSGKIVIGGSLTIPGRSRLARLNLDGSRDTSFDSVNPGYFDNQVVALTVQPDDKILVGGYFTAYYYVNPATSGVTRDGIARLQSTGALDTAFNPRLNSGQGYPYVGAVTLLPGGNILLGGNGFGC